MGVPNGAGLACGKDTAPPVDQNEQSRRIQSNPMISFSLFQSAATVCYKLAFRLKQRTIRGIRKVAFIRTYQGNESICNETAAEKLTRV